MMTVLNSMIVSYVNTNPITSDNMMITRQAKIVYDIVLFHKVKYNKTLYIYTILRIMKTLINRMNFSYENTTPIPSDNKEITRPAQMESDLVFFRSVK